MVLVGCSFTFALAGLEFAVRAFVPVRNVGPAFSEYDPIYGKRLKASFQCTRITPEFSMRLTTNAHGHRGPELPRLPQGAIWFLGDSYTEGYGVDDGQEYPALIRNQLRKRHGAAAPAVVNAGIGDVGNGRWLKFLRREAPDLQPSLIVLQMTGNDFFDNKFEDIYRLQDDGTLAENAIRPPGRLRAVQRFADAIPFLPYSYTFGALRQVSWTAEKGEQVQTIDVSDPVSDPLTYRILSEILSHCSARSWPTILILTGLNDEREARVRQLARGVPVIAVPAASVRPDFYFRVDAHWNAAGHRWVADQVLPEAVRLGPPSLRSSL